MTTACGLVSGSHQALFELGVYFSRIYVRRASPDGTDDRAT